MNDLHYIFYDAKRMYLDTVEMTGAGERAHRRLCDYIWFSGRVPFNHDPKLCQITSTKETDWPGVKAELTEKGWLIAGDFLIHRGAVTTLNESRLRYVENFNRGCKMNRREPLVASEPDSTTGLIEVRKPGLAAKLKKEPHGQAARATTDAGAAILTPEGAARVAAAILRNATGWHYDNAKVTPQMFVARTLAALLKPYEGRVTEKAALTAWHEAAIATHQAAVDGLVKTTVAGYCIATWRDLLGAVASVTLDPTTET